MKAATTILTFAIIIAVAIGGGCVPGLKSAKQSTDQLSEPSKMQADPGQAQTSTPENREKPENGQVNPPEPRYEPPGPSERDKLLAGGVDPREKAEVTESALEFSRKNVPGLKHVKVCFSKLYGGWYMLAYVEKGKKLSMQHWAWNQKSKEWEILSQQKELSPKQLEFELKGEVAGEKCFILK
ncbi:MAG TPA: hypothetical protein VK463_17890 [Desulfomonilaceae bacterium]|nr:hypothetical protein [Desulfomonilaceae bacterium]